MHAYLTALLAQVDPNVMSAKDMTIGGILFLMLSATVYGFVSGKVVSGKKYDELATANEQLRTALCKTSDAVEAIADAMKRLKGRAQ